MANPNTREVRTIEELRERRERTDGSLDRMTVRRLAIPDRVKTEYPAFSFRWINDISNRLHVKTEYDTWQKVPGVEPLVVDTREGQPVKAYLCMKPLEFIREDAAAKEAVLQEQEKGILGGNTDEAALSGNVYVGKETSIKRGRLSG